MKCHQILTGAVNSGDNTYSCGSVEGIHFTAYSSGCNIVILSATFERVQILPGVLHGNVQVNCLDASTDVGKIAACYGGPIKSNQLPTCAGNSVSNRIVIFEPTPIIGQFSEHRLDYSWIKTSEIEPNSAVNVLSLNLEGNKLLTGGVEIQLWHLTCNQSDVARTIQNTQQTDEGLRMRPIKSKESNNKQHDWICVWSCKTSAPVGLLSFSPDGTLFASIGRSDRLVKIWHESAAQNQHFNTMIENGNFHSSPSLQTSSSSGLGQTQSSALSFSFIYIAHPRAVTGLSWRKVSKYMPKGSVANMLVTSCRDNICRLWVQTFLPDDGLVNVSQLEGVSNLVTPRQQTQSHRNKLIQRFKYMKTFTHFKRRTHPESGDGEGGSSGGLHRNDFSQESFEPTVIPNLPSTFSAHDFHGFGVHGTAVVQGGLHFHLTASINGETDIPLVPSLTQHPSETNLNTVGKVGPKVILNNESMRPTSPTGHYHAGLHHHEESDKPLFVINWLNNKEIAFTQGAEKVLHEIVANIIESERQSEQGEQQRQQEENSNATAANNNAGENVVDGGIHSKGPSAKVPPVGSFKDLNAAGQTFTSPQGSSSTNSLATMTASVAGGGVGMDGLYRKTVADYFDRRLETLLREWHTTSDLLYSIHPLDGSLLVWLVEWLDESTPSNFRHPQVSFSSRIPSSIPLGDASTMSHNVALYAPSCYLDLKTVLFTSPSNITTTNQATNPAGDETSGNTAQRSQILLMHKAQQQHYQNQQPLFGLSSLPTSTLCMVTKHNNGSLNLWQLTFAERSQFSQLLSISHSRRVCGHRFRVNDITCHPILPLLLTTSHHNKASQSRKSQSSPFELHTPNTPDSTSYLVSPSNPDQPAMVVESSTFPNTGFCSELILWKVDPVGPLLKSGGVTELARINSLESTAFANVAWIPTLLPSTALGNISNSPSACFVASDGRQLRIYQAVIDARSLLAEAQRYMLNTNDRRRFYYDSSDEEDEEYTLPDKNPFRPQAHNSQTSKSDHDTFRSLFKIVSLQSTARPGCVLELSPIVDARHDWQNTQLLHIFQEQLIFGNQTKPSSGRKDIHHVSSNNAPEITLPDGPIIDLSHAIFEEVFFLLVVEKTGNKSTLHMWEIKISSRGKASLEEMQSSNENFHEDEDSSRSASPESNPQVKNDNCNNTGQHSPPLLIRTRKVCTQVLPLPSEVEVIHATPAAGHLSSSNIFPACYAPFLLTTACSDNKIRFWRCHVEPATDELNAESKFTWLEWEMNLQKQLNSLSLNLSLSSDPISSAIELPGSPLYVSCAFSGRLACAFKFGHSYVDLSSSTAEKHQQGGNSTSEEKRYINIGIVIYECQSSGGSEWILEDTIKIDRIPLLETGNTSVSKISDLDIAPLVDTTLRNQQTSRKITTQISSNSLASNNPFGHSDIGADNFDNSSDPTHRVASIQRMLAVPSYTTLQSLKKIIAEQGNQFTFFQKSPVLLDWVSTEDGSHILTCSAGHKTALFAPISQRGVGVSQGENNPKQQQQSVSMEKSGISFSGLLPQQQSIGSTNVSPSNFRANLLDSSQNTVSITRWMLLRINELSSVDGLPPLPMQLSWVRDGILVVGMDNEMLIFTQWKMPISKTLPHVFEHKLQERIVKRPYATEYPYDSVDFPTDRFVSISKVDNEQDGAAAAAAKPDIFVESNNIGEKIVADLPDDFGLFEAFRLSSPVIPQYHPKQLMELLAFGKIHRVRAILSHLVSSLCSINSIKEYLHHPSNMQQHGNSFEAERSPRSWTRTRALSIAQQPSPHEMNSSPLDNSYGDNVPIVAEEIQLDYTEIASIRPLPLYALIQADEGISSEQAKQHDEKPNQNDLSFALGLDGNDSLDPDSLFDYSYKTQVEETLDEFLGNRTAFNFSNIATSKFLKQQQAQQNELDTGLKISIHFDQSQARLLTKLLTHSHLPGLTSLDQMHLLALADSLASFNELSTNKQHSERNLERMSDSTNNLASNQPLDEQQLSVAVNSLDDCGLRYLLNMRQHVYLLKCLPLMQRKALQMKGLGLHNIIWAFHSETQEELIQLVTSGNKINWQDLRELGVGYWIRNNSLLRKVIEMLAKLAFKANNDPLDASLYYLAMRKKNLVWGLYRSIQDKKMTDFFSHDFSEDKWRKAALKNAYALMGKQRFEHAVSFFLLAGSLWDAVEICLNKLNDFQLAMIIIRLHEGGDIETVPETLKKLLHEEILGYRPNGVQDLQHAHPDPFLRSMAYWMLHEYNLSLSTLLEVNVGSKYSRLTTSGSSTGGGGGSGGSSGNRNTFTSSLNSSKENNFEGLHPCVFNFYLYLRTQPLIVRRAQVAAQHSIVSSILPEKSNSITKMKKSHMFSIGTTNRSDAVAITPFERRLFFLTAYRHLRAGCPSLALEVLSRLPANIMSCSEKNEIEECSRRLSVPDTSTSIGRLSNDTGKSPPTQQQPKKEAKAEDLFGGGGGFDWGTPSSLFQPVDTDDFKLSFEDDKNCFDDEDDDGLQMKPTKEEKKKPVKDDDDDQSLSKQMNIETNKIDVMAQQFKFISCLKILMQELSTLATGFEVDGGQLRYQLYIWLERSVQILKEICNYHTFSLRSTQSRGSIDNVNATKGLVPLLNATNSKQGPNILVNTSSRVRKTSDHSNTSATGTAQAPSLHEILLADKEDFELKLERCRRRKAWLISNEALLRNLLSYCSLHGAQGGGLASVRMELILLLQELQQDRSPQQQLLSPLPLQTTLPLLTASVASQKTVVADPIRHLQSVIHDILQTLTDLSTFVHMPIRTNYSSRADFLALPPFMVSGTATHLTAWASLSDGPQQGQQSSSYAASLYTMIHILRDLGISLSSCLYQSLCDCDTVIQNCSISSTSSRISSRFNRNRVNGKKTFLSSKYGGNKDMDTPTTSAAYANEVNTNTTNAPAAANVGEEPLMPTTVPLKWPGVQSLHALIVRDKDEDLPKLHTLLCEGFVAVYLSQLVYALTICDSSILYRLVCLKFDEKTWGDLFGGGAKKLLYVSTASAMAAALGPTPGSASPGELLNGSSSTQHNDLLNTLSKQRMKLHMKILEQLNQASAAAVAAGAAAAEAVSAVSAGMVNAATSPSSTFQSISSQFSQQPHTTGVMTAAGVSTAEQRPTYRELFVPPQVSIVNFLMMKPELPDELIHLDYDSVASEDEAENELDSTIEDKFKTGEEIDDDEYNEWANDGKNLNVKVDRAAEKRKTNLEYELYAWCIIRLAVTKIAYEQLENFITVSGLEKGDLPTTSPYIHSMLNTLKRWQRALQFYMNEFTVLPDHFLPNMYVDTERTQGPLINKYKSLFETNNTPFRSGYTSFKSSKRLWNYLVRHKSVQDIFIRYIFSKSRSSKLVREHGATAICNSLSGTALSEQTDNTDATKVMQPGSAEENVNQNVEITPAGPMGKRMPEPIWIVHKDQDQINAFCMNRANLGYMALATQKEIQELNIKPLLDTCVPWMEEDTELDILNLRQRQDLSYSSSSYVDFLLVQHPSDRLQTSIGGQAFQKQVTATPSQQQTPTKQAILPKHHFQGNTNPYFCRYIFERSRHLFMPVKRHKTETVRRLVSHPTLSLYLSGGQDGSVVMWEWNHLQPISTPRAPGTYAKVTRVQFNQQGNKFGVADGDGNLSLWPVTPTQSKSFFSTQCHNKNIADFTFLGASSLLMTAGLSTDHNNVALWDTLMPTKKCMIYSFTCHESGASSIVYAPQNQLIITGGKKGEVFIFDMRQRAQLSRFQAHDSAIKCIALDPGEDFFATGSADGDIKVWSLCPPRTLLFTFQQEHNRSTFFRSTGMGVSHLYIDNCGRLFSCGADGSLKMRHLPTIECHPKWYFSPTSSSTQSIMFGTDGENFLRTNGSSFVNGNGVVNTY